MSFDLSPELLKAIAPNADPEKAQIKFDDAGTLHVLERSNDGALLHDYALKHVEEKIQQEQGNTKSEELRLLKQSNKVSRYYYLAILLSVIVLLFECIYYVENIKTISLAVLISSFTGILLAIGVIIYSVVKLALKYFKR